MALRPEAQTLLTVVQTVDWLRPAPIAHWRAGFWPRLETEIRRRADIFQGEYILCGENIAKEDFLDV
jgi:hypothetical protein